MAGGRWQIACVTYVTGILINVVGLAVRSDSNPLAATRIYELCLVTGFGISAVVYWILNCVFLVVEAADTFEEIDVSWYEHKASVSRDVEEMNTDVKDAGSETASE